MINRVQASSSNRTGADLDRSTGDWVEALDAIVTHDGPYRARQILIPLLQRARHAPSGITPSNIMSPAPEPTRGSRTEVRLGARAHTITCPANRAHGPPGRHPAVPTRQPGTTRLTCGPCTSKELVAHADRIEELRTRARNGPLTIVYAARDRDTTTQWSSRRWFGMVEARRGRSSSLPELMMMRSACGSRA
jgi:hypothetical protein